MAIEYARHTYAGKKALKFFISSNGTTLTPKVISWLEKNEDVELTITLNGPQHDRYRHFSSGKGSLETILSSIKIIKESSPSLWNRIDFVANIVTYSELIELSEFYKEYIEKPPVMITGIYSQNGNEIIKKIIEKQDDSQNDRKTIHDLYIEHADPYIKPFYNFNMVEIMKRPIRAVNRLYRTSCCMPFTCALFVDSDGVFGMCEKVGSDKHLGNIDSGINEKAVIVLMKNINQVMNEQCRLCWAQRLCSACFQDFGKDENGNYFIIPKVCKNIRHNLKADLQMFCEIQERNPEFFEKLRC